MMLAAALCLVLSDPPQSHPTDRNRIEIAVDLRAKGTPISPLIYGANDSAVIDQPWTLWRFGGNSATTYNWENNFDNAGADWKHSSGYGWSMRTTPESTRSQPAAAIIHHHEAALKIGAQSLVQVPMMGYVAADGNGTIEESERAPSPRWKRVEPKKPGPFSPAPDLNDDVVYVDEMVAYLVKRFGPASSPRGIKAYGLDNEPGLWNHTHSRAHPEKVGAKELMDKSIATAAAIKAVDPSARIHGWQPFGIWEMVHLLDAPDWPAIQKAGGYDWYLDYYLDQFKKASNRAGRRLLDVLDVHLYIEGGTKDEAGTNGLLQAPRILNDPTFTEQTWLGEVVPDATPVLPRIRRSIARYFPGTQICISEWNTQQPTTITGAVSTVDFLGAIGEAGVEMATWWSLLPVEKPSGDFPEINRAFALFLNADGKGLRYGDRALPVTNGRRGDLSAYAAEDTKTGNLHLMLVGKRRHVPFEAVLKLPKGRYRSAAGYGMGQTLGVGSEAWKDVRFDGTTLTVTMPKQSAVHVVLERNR